MRALALLLALLQMCAAVAAAGSVQQAHALILGGRFEEALAMLAALGPAPKADLLRGIAYEQQGRGLEALEAFRTAVVGDPLDADALRHFGAALQARGAEELQAASLVVWAYERALELDPQFAAAHLIHSNLAAALRTVDRMDDAVAHCRQALQLQPGYVGAYVVLCGTLQLAGRNDEAIAACEEALRLDPQQAHAFKILAGLRRFTLADGDLLHDMEALVADPDTSRDFRINTLFALGKAQADLEDWGRSFGFYAAGNALKRSTLDFSLAKAAATFDRIAKVFDRDFVRRHSGHGYRDARPIFIVGLPRGGSTLVEQILGSHSAVATGGEHSASNSVIRRLQDGYSVPGGPMYPELMQRLVGSAWSDFGAAYHAEMKDRHQLQAPLAYTDKMLYNFIHVGLLHLALPNARFIHATRDPLDHCWSQFTTLMTSDVNSDLIFTGFSYDLVELGQFHRLHTRLMDHWKAVVPAAALLTVQYEDMVGADHEAQVRRLLDFAGLPWEEGCLRFYENKRTVATASTSNVRQPIYRTSVGRSEPYAAYLEPLRASLATIGADAHKNEL